MAWLRFDEPKVLPEQRSLVMRDGETVPVRWVRDVRARRLRLIVNEKGARLTLPRSASVKMAERFLFEHRDWLQTQLAQPPLVVAPPFSCSNDNDLLLRDERLPIDWCEGRFMKIARCEHGVRIVRPAASTDRQLRSALRVFYRQQALADVQQWLPKYLPALPSAPTAIKLRAVSTLWGSLSPSDALTIDLALVLGRPSAFEYVLVHELCHLIHRNHSRRFWREVEARWPQWPLERDYLHGDGLLIKAQLRRFAA